MIEKNNYPIPLFVDLDGTFIKTDMLFESFISALKNNPLIIFLCLLWLIKGRAYLKYKLSQRADLETPLLPLNPEFHSFLLGEKTKNRKIILATASNEKYANEICENYDLFDSYISSDASTNLKGKNKLEKIKTISDHFAYAGNGSEDFEIFSQADESYLVNPTYKAVRMSSKISFIKIFDKSKTNFKIWMKQIRTHQWLKNCLIFVPLFVSGKFTNVDALYLSVLGFLSFSCLASATYIINDLLDLESDRSHTRKKSRPIAAGNIGIDKAIMVAVILFSFSLYLAFIIKGMFAVVLIAYLAITLLYSFVIKELIGMDVIILASLYTIRILAGGAILNVTISFWLLSFSMFVFLSLAIIKRCAELKSFEGEEKTNAKGRDYGIADYNVLMSLGTSSALLSVLMFVFYTNSNILTNQYQKPTILWLIVPALSYWLIRMWVKTNRGEMHDDPIVFSLRDKGSLVTIGFIILIALMAQAL